MISFWRIFWLEFVALTRSKALTMLLIVSSLWTWFLPRLIKGDGTAEGARELYVHFSLGGVFILLVVVLLAAVTGAIARERQAKRLQLTMIRPVHYWVVAFGKIVAHVAIGAIVLLVSGLLLLTRVDCARECFHVIAPTLPTPAEEARAMYESYMNDPSTPETIKHAKKSIVIRLLTQKAADHFQTVGTNQTAEWQFDGLKGHKVDDSVAVRMRFTNQMEMRQDVLGNFQLGVMSGGVSNVTQSILTIPLRGDASKLSSPTRLSFENKGKTALMFRPRKDIALLTPADTFAWNLLRSYVMMVAILMVVISTGIFLSASLGRPVAIFVAFVMLILSEMSPSVVDQYPDQLETNAIDRIGLYMTRFVAEVTRPISSASVLEELAQDECVESSRVAKFALINLVSVPLAISFLAAFIMPRKQED